MAGADEPAPQLTRFQTLQNLDSFVDQYQDLRRPEEGAVAARSWKPILLRNYKKIWWTTEGGNIQALRDMLQMHVNSISLTVQALQRWVRLLLLARYRFLKHRRIRFRWGLTHDTVAANLSLDLKRRSSPWRTRSKAFTIS